jgi:hypothetical protein
MQHNTRPKLYAVFFSIAGEDHVEIGDKGAGWSNIEKVTPVLIARWPTEWATYSAGREGRTSSDGSIPLTRVPGLGGNIAALRTLSDKGIDCAEHLAALDDRSAMLLDEIHGRIWRDTAKLVLEAEGKKTAQPTGTANNTLRALNNGQNQKAA